MSDIRIEKTNIRKDTIKKRSSMDSEFIEESGKQIAKLVLSMEDYKKSDIVLMYYPVRNEANVRDLFEISLNMGKKVAMPRVLNKCDMEFYVTESWEDLAPGYMDIYEPREGLSLYTYKPDIKAFMAVPGVAFDKKGGRIGMGRGYYDRYLKKYPYIKTCGVCMEYQLIDKIPMEKNDIYIKYIVTEKKIYDILM